MLKCPICGVELSNTVSTCPMCGFDQLGKEFVNKDDCELWLNTVVKTCRSVYCTTKRNAIKNASYKELRDEFVLRPPIDYYMQISRVQYSDGRVIANGTLQKDIHAGLILNVGTISDFSFEAKYRKVAILSVERNGNNVSAAFAGEDVNLLLDLPQESSISEEMYLV